MVMHALLSLKHLCSLDGAYSASRWSNATIYDSIWSIATSFSWWLGACTWISSSLDLVGFFLFPLSFLSPHLEFYDNPCKNKMSCQFVFVSILVFVLFIAFCFAFEVYFFSISFLNILFLFIFIFNLFLIFLLLFFLLSFSWFVFSISSIKILFHLVFVSNLILIFFLFLIYFIFQFSPSLFSFI